MRLVMLDGIDLAQVRNVVGVRAFAAGKAYVLERRVTRTEWLADDQVLLGVVRGGDTYTVEASLSTGRDGVLQLTDSACDCPVGIDCKHVAALILRVATGRAAPAGPPVAPPTWAAAFDALLNDPRRADRVSERHPIALELSVVATPVQSVVRGAEPLAAPPRITARLVRPGRGGWVAGGLSWSKLGQSYYMGEYRPEHVRLLRELHALYGTRSTAPSYVSYGEEKSLDLAAIDSPHLWSLLDEAAAVGVQLVHSRKALGPLPPPGRARVLFDVTGHDPIVVTPTLRVHDQQVDAVPVRFVGAQGHGVVWVPAEQVHGGDPAQWALHLARLDAPAPAALQRLVLAGRRLTVPAQERDRFDGEYALRLRAMAPLESSDGEWTPPVVSAPELVLDATFGEHHGLELAWEWVYDVAGAQVRSPFASAADPDKEPHRDPAAERAQLQAASGALDSAGLTVDGMSARHLDGLGTLRFTTETLPLLSDIDGVRVEVRGRPAPYRDAGDTLTISVSTDVSADGGTDWFDLGVEVTVDGHTVAFEPLFRALAADEPCLLLEDGSWFSLDKPELRSMRALIEEARALSDRPSGPLRISRFQAGLWEELAELGVVSRQAAAWREQVQSLLAGTADPTPLPDGLRAQLRPYQLDGYRWLVTLWRHRLGGLLADDMGLGKTLQALALICHARATDPDAPAFLVVAPTSVLPNWAAEAARFTPELRVVLLDETLRRRGTDLATAVAGADIVVTTYALLRLDVEAHAAHVWSGLLLDEAQHVKNHNAAGYRAARRVVAPFKVAISGTPMENNLMELWSLLSITAPGLFPHPTTFREHFAVPIEKGDGDSLARLRRRVRPLLTRRTKEQVALDLPEKFQQVLAVELDPKHRRSYQRHLQRERQKVLGLIDDVERNRFTILTSLTLLRRLALHPGLVDDTQLGTSSAKVDALVEHLTEVVAGGHRALVFSQFTGFLSIIRTALAQAGIDHLYLDGATTRRGPLVQRFRDGAAPVFLISLKAGGAGLNLTEADYVFILDPWWNPATEAQAIDRTHRIGQTRTVHVFRLIATDTIEEKVRALAIRKAELVSGVLDTGDPFDGRLSADDIRELLT